MRTFQEFKNGEEKNIFNAVWQYLIDHADITAEGVYFIKFHTNNKETFANHIRARMRGVYRNKLDEMTGLAELRRVQHQNSVLNGMKKKEEKRNKNVIAKNVLELQRNHKTKIYRKTWWEKLKDYLTNSK